MTQLDLTDYDETRLHLLDIADLIEGNQYARADEKILALLSANRQHLATQTQNREVEA